MTTPDMATFLALPEVPSVLAAYADETKIEAIIVRIEEEARSIVPDLSSKKGRDAITSYAYKITRSKTTMDAVGKTLTADARATIDGINKTRRLVVTRLDALNDEVRKPLKEWEEAEEARLAEQEARLDVFNTNRVRWDMKAADIVPIIEELRAIDVTERFDPDFQLRAVNELGDALTGFKAQLVMVEDREAQEVKQEAMRVEMERMKAVEAESQRKQEAMRQEAEATAKAAAEAEREREAKATEQRAIEAARLEAEQRAIEVAKLAREKADAAQEAAEEAHKAERIKAQAMLDEANKKAEAARLDAINQAEQAQARYERQVIEAKAAAKAELERQAVEAKKAAGARIAAEAAEREQLEREEAEAETVRANDVSHRAAIRADILVAIVQITTGDKSLDDIALVEALMAGQIPHVEVQT